MGRKRKEFIPSEYRSLHEISKECFNHWKYHGLDISEIKPKGKYLLFWSYRGKYIVAVVSKVIRSQYFNFHVRSEESDEIITKLKAHKSRYNRDWFVRKLYK